MRPLLLSIREASGFLGVHPNTLRRWDQDGRLRAVRVGRRKDRRYYRADLLRHAGGVENRDHLARTVRRAAVAGVVVLTLLLAYSGGALVRAGGERTINAQLQPSRCSGWTFGVNAQTVSLNGTTNLAAYGSSNSAIFSSGDLTISSDAAQPFVSGRLDQSTGILTCSRFTGVEVPNQATLSNVQVNLWLATTAATISTDTLTLAVSTDGLTWTTVKTFAVAEPVRGRVSFFLPTIVDPAQLKDLQFRLTPDIEPAAEPTTVFVDGLTVSFHASTPAPEPTKTKRPARAQLDRLVEFSKEAYRSAEHPLVTVPKTQVAQFLFFKQRPVEWQLEQIELIDTQGQHVQPTFSTREISDGASVQAQLSINPDGLHAGKYRLRVTMINSEGGAAAIEKDFLWGVIALNVTHAVARPGDEQVIGMAVLDDNGKTICDADLKLVVTDPKGKKATYSSGKNTVEISGLCVDQGVTNLPDYSVTSQPQHEGLYHLHLEAKTRAGTRTYEDTFQVDPLLAFDVDRYDFPTRLYPPSPYTARFAVTPRHDFQGVIKEKAPANFALSQLLPEGRVYPATDDPAAQIVEWSVDWKADTTYYFQYTFDAPDVSPALFMLGPLKIGDDLLAGALFVEPRQWQLAADSLVSVSGTLYSNEGTTALDCSATNRTVNVKVNGAGTASTTCTAADGTYTVSSVSLAAAGDVVTVYIDGATEDAVTVTRSADATSNITGVDLYQNRVIVRHEDAGPITNTNLDNWDSGNDADVQFTVTAGALTVASGAKLLVWTGKTFTPGGTVTTTAASTAGNPDGDVNVQSTATLSMGTNALSVGGDYSNSGTFSKSSGQTTTFTGTVTGFTIAPGTGNFDSLTFNGAGGDWTPSAAVSVDATLTMTNGTLKGTNNVTITGAVAGTSGIITLTGGTFKQRVAASQNFGTTSGSNTWTFYNLTFSNSSAAIRNITMQTGGTGDITITNVLTLGEVGDSFATGLNAGNRNYNLTGAGSPFVTNAGGTLFGQTSTFIYSGSPSNVTIGPVAYNNLTLGLNDANSVIYVNSSSVSATGTTTVSTGDTWTCNAGCSVGNSSTGAGTLVIDGTINGSSFLTYYSNTAFPTGGTMNLILWMHGAATGSQTLSARTYGANVQFLCTCAETITLGTGAGQTFTFSNGLNIAENGNGVNYTVDAATYDPTMNITGALDFNGNSGTTGIEILNAGAGTWTVSTNVDFNDAGGQAGQYNYETNNLLKMTGTNRTINTGGNALNDYEIASGGSNNVTINGNTTINGNVTITSGALTAPSSGTLTIGGTFTNNSTFTHNSSTVTMNGTSKNIAGSSNTTFNSLTISGTITLTASNPTVNTVLQVDTSTSLTINSGLTVALARNNASDSLTLNGTINGPGRLTYRNATANSFTTSGTLAASLIVRFDTVNGNLTIPARTDYGVIEAYGASANARTVTLGTAASQTITTSSHFYVIADAASPNHVTIAGGTNNPTVNIGGDLDYTGTGTANEIITSGTGTWTVSGNVDFTAGTYTATSGTTLVMNGASKTLTTNANALVNLTFSGSGTTTLADSVSASGNVTLNSTISAGTTTFTMTGTSNTLTGGSATIYNLTIDPSSAGTITLQTSDLTVANTLTVAASDTLSLNASRTLTLTGNSGTTLTINGTISGSGKVIYQNSVTTLTTAGTLSSAFRFDTVNGSMSAPARTYGGTVEAVNGSGATRTLTLGTAVSQTLTFSSNLDLQSTSAGSTLTLAGDTNNPTISLTGSFTNSNATAATTVSMGSGAWTVSGNFDLTNVGTFNHNSGKLVMAGTGTLTSNGKTLNNVDINSSGTVTLAAASHTLAGNLLLAGTGTPTVTGSTVVMTGTTKTIDGGGKTLSNLTISGDTTLQNTDLTVSGTLQIDSLKTLTINASRLLTHSGATLTLNGTIAGAGTYVYQSATTFPTSGTISSRLRMDATNNAQTMSARTYGGLVEVYNNNSTTDRTVTIGTGASQTLTFSNALNPLAVNNGDITLDGDANDPTVNITGDLDFTGSGNGVEVIAAGEGTWTVGGNVDFTGGVYGPSILAATPSWDITAYRNQAYDIGCFISTSYNCDAAGATSLDVYQTDTSSTCDTEPGNLINYRAGTKFDPSSISDSATVMRVQLFTYVGTALGTTANLARSTTDNLESVSCTASGTSNVWSKIGGSDYGTVDWTSTGPKLTDLGTSGVSDVQSRLTAGSLLSVGVNVGSTVPIGSFNSVDNSTSKPKLFIAYATATTHTLLMNGTSKTLTSGANTLYNLTLSGTITLANATHTVVGNLDMTSGTITQGTSTVVMSGGGKTLTGAGQTLNNLTIDPPTAGTITLADSGVTNDLTVAGTVNIASGDTLSIASSAQLLHSGSTLTLNGTISGSGTYVYQSSTAFPTGGTISSVLRMDATNNDQILSARTYGGAVELYSNSSAAARTVTAGTAGSQTLTFSSDLTLNAANSQNITLQGATWDPTLNITGIFDFTGGGGGTEVVTAPDAAATWTVTGNVDLDGGTWTAASETLKMDGTANLGGGGNTVKNVTIDGNAKIVTVTGTDISVSGLLTLGGAADGNNDTLTIASGRLVTLSANSGTSLTVNASGTDTINGPGRLTYQNSATTFPTAGTLASTLITRFDTVNGNMTIPARTDYSVIEAYGSSANARTVALGTAASQTITTSSHFYVVADAASPNDVTVSATTNNPTINVGGDLDFTGTGTASEIIQSGTGTWTVSGNVDFTSGTYTATSGNTLVMNGTTKTLTSAAQTLQNVTLSGTITLANATHTVAGNLSLAGGTITAGTSTVTLTGTANSLTGGGNTLNNLTIDPSSAGTITLQTSDVTVSGTLTVETGDTLSLSAGRLLTHSGATLTLNGTIAGSGTLVIPDTSGGPGTTGTLSSGVRFDATNANIAATTLDARTYGGAVELYSNAAGSPARTITFPTGTFTFSSTVTTNRANTGTITVDADTNDPAVTVAGTLTIGASTTLSASSASAFNVNGNYTNNGTFTDNLGTVTLAGSAQQTLSGTMTGLSDFNNLTLTNNSGTDADSSPSVILAAAADVAGTATIATANVKVRFNAGSTYAWTAINLNGQATTTRVKFRSSTGGTQFNFNAGAGARTVSNTEVKDSNACGSSGGSIDASDGTNFDAGNTSCWTIHTISFSVSDNAVGFGSLSTSTGRWATGDALGTNASAGSTPTAAHTLSVATSGTSGYAVTYLGALLSSGANTISAATITSDSDGAPGTEQFGVSASTDGNATIASGYARGANSSWNFVPDATTTLVSESVSTTTETVSVSYLGNITGTTEAGSYSTVITYIMTATY
ncbi:MAG: helix-turn-helix domain-containing protein [Candidatus Kerfeldbacteria bacterium]|nr:helix-turn-helix domain-containing protein [Candidatus Kerfeldbacteria bacterium]